MDNDSCPHENTTTTGVINTITGEQDWHTRCDDCGAQLT